MNITKAVEILEKYNSWRRWDDEFENGKSPEMPHPKQIGIALDTVVKYFKVTKINTKKEKC